MDYVHSKGLIYSKLHPSRVLMNEKAEIKLLPICFQHMGFFKEQEKSEKKCIDAYTAPEIIFELG